MDIFTLIKSNVLFSNFNNDEINAIFDCLKGKMKKLTAGTIVSQKGDKIDNISIILKGKVIKFRTKENGENEAIEELSEGEAFGDVEGFLPNPRYSYSVVSSKDCLILNIDISSIVRLSEESYSPHQKLINNCLANLARKVLGLENDSEYLVIKSMRLKIAKLIYDTYKKQNKIEIDLNLNRNEMAEYLNVSRPSMSREMCRMRDEGMFDFRKSIIKIKNLRAIEDIVKTGEKPKA